MWFLIESRWISFELRFCGFDIIKLKEEYRKYGAPIIAIARLKSKIDNKQTRD